LSTLLSIRVSLNFDENPILVLWIVLSKAVEDRIVRNMTVVRVHLASETFTTLC